MISNELLIKMYENAVRDQSILLESVREEMIKRGLFTQQSN